MTEIAQSVLVEAPATPPAAPAGSAAPFQPVKLDWSRVAPPRNLESVRVEELSIDGICGVY